jgi:UDP-N-acetyl-D-glucosamine dehydrogenase
MIESSMMINDRMPEYTVERAAKILNHFKKSVNGSNILLLGVAYKQDIDDYRESPALKVVELLERLGAKISFFDPYVSEYRYNGKTMQGLKDLSSKVVEESDLVMITTAHSKVDYQMVHTHAKMIFDTKNILKSMSPRENIEVL